MFPLGYREAFGQWWANVPAAVTEHKVLSFVPYLQAAAPTQTSSLAATTPEERKKNPLEAESHAETTTTTATDPYGPRRWNSTMVELSGKDRALNEFSVERIGEEVENNLVILHGYGAGLGFFYKNFEALSRPKGWQLYALDMLGMGRSSRPPFKLPTKDKQQSITAAEDWFIDALEEWRIKKNIDRFTLMGHSMGGYMAVAYALKYPGRLNKLILASPVGIPEDPFATSAAMPEPESSTMGNEFTQDQSETAPKTGDNNNFLNARSKAEKAAKKNGINDENPPPRKPLPKWLVYLWDANFSPFSFVRYGGFLGPVLCSGWTSRRFSQFPAEEKQALHDYSYSLFRMKGSGEYALAYILAPGAFARSPLIRRIQGVGRQMIESAELNGTVPKAREDGIPVVLYYGENDWMDIKGGYAAKDKMDAERSRILKEASSEEKERDNGSAKVITIPRAGHHVYLDNAEDFNKSILEEMEDVERREKLRKARA